MQDRARHLLRLALVGTLALFLSACQEQGLPTESASLSSDGSSPQLAEGECLVTSTENSGAGSLREAVGDEDCSTITFDASLEGETITLSSPMDAIDDTNDPVDTRHLSIVGLGADLLTVRSDPDDPFNIFGILKQGSELEISGLTLAEADRAIINDLGTLTVSEMVFRDNITSSALGGPAIFSGIGATTSVHTSTFQDNRITTFHQEAGGGAIRNEGGTLDVTASTFVGNRAPEGSGPAGGAIMNTGLGTATTTITASTFTENMAHHGGAVASSNGDVTIVASTISGNWMPEGGGSLGGPQLEAFNSTIELRGTIVIDPEVDSENCSADPDSEISSDGYNLSDDETCNLVGDGDQQGSGVTADLGALRDNGGPTHTMLPGEDSDALGVIPVESCSSVSSDTDQRGVERPQGDACDVGAVEIEVADDPPPTYDFGGFEEPVDGAPEWNVAKAGQVVPVRFSLGGFQGMDILAEGSPSSQEIDCQDTADSGDAEAIDSPGKSGLSYDETTDEYQLNWKTERRWQGTCRELVLELDDGSLHGAQFQLR